MRVKNAKSLSCNSSLSSPSWSSWLERRRSQDSPSFGTVDYCSNDTVIQYARSQQLHEKHSYNYTHCPQAHSQHFSKQLGTGLHGYIKGYTVIVTTKVGRHTSNALIENAFKKTNTSFITFSLPSISVSNAALILATFLIATCSFCPINLK